MRITTTVATLCKIVTAVFSATPLVAAATILSASLVSVAKAGTIVVVVAFLLI